MRIFRTLPQDRVTGIRPGGSASLTIGGRRRRFDDWVTEPAFSIACGQCGRRVDLEAEALTRHCFVRSERPTVFPQLVADMFDRIYDWGWDSICPDCGAGRRIVYGCIEAPPHSSQWLVALYVILETKVPVAPDG